MGDMEKREERDQLESSRARAERARAIGERLIREDYHNAACAIAATLFKLRAIDELIAGVTQRERQ
jgi:hypothetical protein